MSQRKCLCSDKASNLSIKQFFSSKPKTPAVAALNLETAIANSTTSSTTTSSLDSGLQNDCTATADVQQKHSTFPGTSSSTVL